MTLLGSLLAVFTATYFYFTGVHALESFDTRSCTPLAYHSALTNCVSSLQKLLKEEEPYAKINADGNFGPRTRRAVRRFQHYYGLTRDGIVGAETAAAINNLSPRPSMLSYAAGFEDSRLPVPAKLWIAIMALSALIFCLLLRAASTRLGSLPAGFIMTGLFSWLVAVVSATTDSLTSQAHGWSVRFLYIAVSGLLLMLVSLLPAIFPRASASPIFDPQLTDRDPGRSGWYGD